MPRNAIKGRQSETTARYSSIDLRGTILTFDSKPAVASSCSEPGVAIPGFVKTGRLKVALLCDFLEEEWPSMDLFGDMLSTHFRQEHAASIQVEQVRPAMRVRFSRLSSHAKVLWSADRLINRFYDYPRSVRKRVASFDLFHIVDHSYAQLALELPCNRTIVTCHDLDTFRCLLEPEAEPRPRWFRTMSKRILSGFRQSAHVICPSESTKAQLLTRGLFLENRVSVIYPGADPIFFSHLQNASRDAVTRLLDWADRDYLLHVGSTVRRKRIDVLLRVFAEIAKLFPNIRLVRVGGPLSGEQSRLATELGIAHRIIQAPHLSKPDLAAVYENAALLLQPSEGEGFGLPVIEAMSRGCPVLASDIPALREAGGSVTEYRPVADIGAWSAAAVELLRKRETHPEFWQSRRATARIHAANFTWRENARRTSEIYHRVWAARQDSVSSR